MSCGERGQVAPGPRLGAWEVQACSPQDAREPDLACPAPGTHLAYWNETGQQWLPLCPMCHLHLLTLLFLGSSL